MQERKHELFGNSYSSKVMVGIIAIDFLFLPVLFSSSKFDNYLSWALNAFCFSLPAAGSYLVLSLALENNRRKWDVVSNHLPSCSKIFKLFLFILLPWLACIACFIGVLFAIVHFSSYAFFILITTTGSILIFVLYFSFISDMLLLKKRIKIPPSDS